MHGLSAVATKLVKSIAKHAAVLFMRFSSDVTASPAGSGQR